MKKDLKALLDESEVIRTSDSLNRYYTKELHKEYNTEKVALYIQKLISDIIMGLKPNITSGNIERLGDLSKLGRPGKTLWSLTDKDLRITLDYSYTMFDNSIYAVAEDRLIYGTPKGFNDANIDLNYLNELLRQQGITVEHERSHEYIESPNWISRTIYTDQVIITLARNKKRTATVSQPVLRVDATLIVK